MDQKIFDYKDDFQSGKVIYEPMATGPLPLENDADKDNIPDFYDNCPNNYNPDQKDSNGNGIGDTCETLKTTTTTSLPETTTTTIPISTTTTAPTNQCVAETLYGEGSEETALLREYRDKVLSKTAPGRRIIKTYYELSPAIAEVLQQNDTARTNARRVLDSLMPVIKEKVKQ